MLNMSSSEFRIVVVGCGGMANTWVETGKSAPGCEIVGLVDIRRQAAEEMAKKHGLPASVVFDTQEQAITATRANLVFDVTIPDAHETVVLTAIKHGCNVIGEKPLSSSIASARKMVDEVTRAGRSYAVMQNRRYDGNIISLRNIITSGAIGGLEELHAEMFVGPHFGGFREQMDYPLLLDMSIHTFDAARFISGADPVSAYCHSFNPKRSWYRGDASAICIFEMTDGIMFSFRGSWCAEGLPADWNSNWRAIGATGTALWDGQTAPRAQAVKPDGKHGFFREMTDVPVTVQKLERGGHQGMIYDALECLRTGRTPQTICTDNIKSLAMVEAAVESAKTGRKVQVKW